MGLGVHAGLHRDAGIGQSAAAQGGEGVDRQHDVRDAGPGGDPCGAVQFDPMALAMVEGDGLDLTGAESAQCPVQAGGGVLPADRTTRAGSWTVFLRARCPVKVPGCRDVGAAIGRQGQRGG